jgi:hypothetical protein
VVVSEVHLPLRQRLKADLLTATRQGDAARVSVIKVLLAAIANAEAVPLDPSQPKEVLGWAEAPRRRLTPEDIRGILRREAGELRAAAAEYAGHGEPGEAARLLRAAERVEGYLDEPVG